MDIHDGVLEKTISRLLGNEAVCTNLGVNQIAAALWFRPLSSGTALSTATTGRKQAKKTAGGFAFRTKQDQWTHKFCCLAEKDACRIPSVEDKLKLRAAGLGEREITLPNNLWCSAKMLLVFGPDERGNNVDEIDLVASGVSPLLGPCSMFTTLHKLSLTFFKFSRISPSACRASCLPRKQSI